MRLKVNIWIIIYLIFLGQLVVAQNVGIGTTTPNSAALLELQSINQGLLLPRMDSIQRDAIISPAIGLTIYNTKAKCIEYYDGVKWVSTCTCYKWTKKKSMPASGRAFGVGFAIGNKGYVGLGVPVPGLKIKGMTDFWEYDPLTDVWTQKLGYPGGTRAFAAGFSLADKGYVACGLAAINPESGDGQFWQYDPALNNWTNLPPYPGRLFDRNVFMVINDKVYMGGGGNMNSSPLLIGYTNEFYEFDPATMAWTPKGFMPGNVYRAGAISFTINNKGYMGNGSSNDDFWEYDPTLGVNGTWTQKAHYGGTPMAFCAQFFVAGNLGFTGLGAPATGSAYYDELWEYHPVANLWVKRPDFPGGGRYGAIAFSINGKGYMGFGFTPDDIAQNDLWELCR